MTMIAKRQSYGGNVLWQTHKIIPMATHPPIWSNWFAISSYSHWFGQDMNVLIFSISVSITSSVARRKASSLTPNSKEHLEKKVWVHTSIGAFFRLMVQCSTLNWNRMVKLCTLSTFEHSCDTSIEQQETAQMKMNCEKSCTLINLTLCDYNTLGIFRLFFFKMDIHERR